MDAAVADIAGATTASSSDGKDEQMAKTVVAVFVTLARSMQVAEVIGAKREH